MAGSEGVRLDAWLVQRGFASGREKAKELLAAGYVTVSGKTVTKASFRVSEGAGVRCAAPAERYVGRGGYKLEKALEDMTVDGFACMDIGASTGGFTDCMLQRGAAHVYAVDVGHGQLHPTLRADGRVTVLEGTDVRSDRLRQAVPAGSVDFCSVDVSFISLESVLPSILPYLRPQGWLVCLIKPQFEAGRAAVGKRGVVKNPAEHRRVLTEMLALFQRLGLSLRRLTYSPIVGGEGNIEYLAVLCRGGASLSADPAAVVAEAHSALRSNGLDKR